MSKKITSEIKIAIELDDNKIAERIYWEAKDGGVVHEESKAMMISLWDSNLQEMKNIDLWTKDMPVDEMKKFFHQRLVAMADMFQRATNDERMSQTIRDFSDYFAEKMELKKAE